MSRMTVAQAIAATEKDILRDTGVAVGHLIKPLASRGLEVCDPLCTRIDVLTEALDPNASPIGSGYKPRRVILALRNALVLALAAEAKAGGPIDERFDRYLLPEPKTLFARNDDFPFSFLSELASATPLFDALPEARVMRFIQRWRAARVSRYLEKRLARVIRGERKALLAGAH